MHEIVQDYGEDPITLFQSWLTDAETQEINDPNAMCLATADEQGRPSARMVLLKEISPKGLRFHTNIESRKGQDIAQNPYGALCIHWKSLRKQIRAEGKLVLITPEESDAYFQTRPRARQIGAWASQQSRNFEHWDDLQTDIKTAEERFNDEDDIPRPPYWQGYRLVPDRIEFWIGQRDRLHTRFEYILKDGIWIPGWVYP